MPKDHKRHLKLNENYDWIDAVEKSDYKAKPREIDNEWIKPYWLARDRILYKENKSRTEILKRYGKK